jgi:hypothetical protein
MLCFCIVAFIARAKTSAKQTDLQSIAFFLNNQVFFVVERSPLWET